MGEKRAPEASEIMPRHALWTVHPIASVYCAFELVTSLTTTTNDFPFGRSNMGFPRVGGFPGHTNRSLDMRSLNTLQFSIATFIVTFGLLTSKAPGQCQSDLTGDGQVNGADLAQVLADWGSCPGTITSVTPLQGSIFGGTQITIVGTNLAATTAIKIGGVACTSLQVLSPTLVKAVTPAGSAGEAPIAIVAGASTNLAPEPYTYVQLAIASVSPSLGIYSGGTTITITGTFLSGATGVKIGGIPATDVVAVNATTVTAVTPAGSAGAVSVEVTGLKGVATADGLFSYFYIVVPTWATLVEALPNPTVVINAALRTAITASGLAWRVRDTTTQMEMLLVPPGQFPMGCTACGGDESPAHEVTLTNAFYVGRYEVMQSQWAATMGANPSAFSGHADSAYRPVERVSWDSVQGYLSATGMRLPTEAEWEFACRAGTTTALHSGPQSPDGTNNDWQAGEIAWLAENSQWQTHAVGGKWPNALGLYDMLGNVWELVSDWYEVSYYLVSPSVNPTGASPSSFGHVMRGGSYYYQWVRSSDRNYDASNTSAQTVGFRAARNP